MRFGPKASAHLPIPARSFTCGRFGSLPPLPKQPVIGPSNERSKFFPVKENLRILMSSKHSTSSSASPVTSYSVQGYLDWISRTHKASSKPEKPASICSTTLSRKAEGEQLKLDFMLMP